LQELLSSACPGMRKLYVFNNLKIEANQMKSTQPRCRYGNNRKKI
jgi:hypothetical protein